MVIDFTALNQRDPIRCCAARRMRRVKCQHRVAPRFYRSDDKGDVAGMRGYQPRNAPDSHPDQCDLTATSYRQCDWRYLGRKRTDSTGGTIRLRHDVNDI